MKCGRIVCAQEGSGPCYFCDNLVCTREEMEKINRTSKKSENLKQELLSRIWDTIGEGSSSTFENDGLKRAIEHKNKLIDFDRTR